MPRVIMAFIAAIAAMIAIPVLLAWSGSRRKLRVARGAGGVLVLRMPRGHYAILASIAILPCAAFVGVALAANWAPGHASNGWVLGGFMGLLGTVVGGYLLGLELRGRIRLDDRSIEKVGALRRRQSSWLDITKITFNPVNNWFFLTLRDGSRLYVVEGLDGIADFGEMALRHLPPAVLTASPDAAEALRDIASG